MSERERNAIQEKDRQQKALKRATMSVEERTLQKEKDKNQKAANRANMTEEERKLKQEKDRDRKREKAEAIKRQTNAENERELNRLYKEKIRKNRTAEQIEFDKLEYVLRKRQLRKEMSKAEKEKEKEQSRIGMKNLRLEGPIMDYQKRSIRDLDELTLWSIFWEKGQSYQDLLSKLKPEIASIITKRLETGGMNMPQDIVDDYDNQLDEWHDDEDREDDKNDSSEIEMSAYEKLREKNIKELEAAKKASGLFD